MPPSTQKLIPYKSLCESHPSSSATTLSADIIKDKPKEDPLDDATLVGRAHPKSQQQKESNICMAENKKPSMHIHKERKKKL
jgi:hypothetical protein